MFLVNRSLTKIIYIVCVMFKSLVIGSFCYKPKDINLRISNMARAVCTILLTVLMVSVYSCGVDSAFTHLQCDSDHQCPEGFFCYESQLCTRCVECGTYKRMSSWRQCPKVPSDCGACLSGFEEDILHEGKTREMCVPSQNTPNSLSHTVVPVHNYERYIWAGAIVVIIVPVVFYAFFKQRERGTIHHGLPREQPPPYRSIELSSLSGNQSEERLAEEEVVLRVGQQKDMLVQAVPFRCPNYLEPQEFMTFDNFQDQNSEGGDSQTVGNSPSAPPNLDLDDENTMPSDWTPASPTASSEQLMSFESGEVSAADLSGSEADDACEPVSKRRRSSDAQASADTHTHLNINLFINNNVTIHKQS